MSNIKMPVLFLGHGSPMNAIEDNEFSRGWKALAARLPRPKAILCISAHWETDGVFVTASSKNTTIHDFGGFPQELFDVQYNPIGNPDLAQKIAELVNSSPVSLDKNRGLDHGAWGVLYPMYPAADIPVIQLSLDRRQAGQFHYSLARYLAPLRADGVLIIASGDIVHNLRMWKFRDTKPYDWALGFNNLVKQSITARQHDDLINYQSLPDSTLAIPTNEHYLPLLYALALQDGDESMEFINDKVESSISMTGVVIGGL
jgi:4,5-DOPA dioxygenase extradiol